jgi:hypothetical protein
MTPQQEQIPYQDILDSYREQVSGLTHELILATCRIKSRDEQIELLMKELDRLKSERDLPTAAP